MRLILTLIVLVLASDAYARADLSLQGPLADTRLFADAETATGGDESTDGTDEEDEEDDEPDCD